MISPTASVALGGGLLAIGYSLEYYQDRKFQQAHRRLTDLYEQGRFEEGAAEWAEYNDNRLVTIALDLFLPCYAVGGFLLMSGVLRLI